MMGRFRGFAPGGFGAKYTAMAANTTHDRL